MIGSTMKKGVKKRAERSAHQGRQTCRRRDMAAQQSIASALMKEEAAPENRSAESNRNE